ncbi:MAG: DUF659 domain-containing protein, partial [Bdellovibrionales bacterium]|nr:DUF659 domain-containing protein [Bdellovibrionales bacterium]
SFSEMSSPGLQSKMLLQGQKLRCSQTYRTRFLPVVYQFALFCFKQSVGYLTSGRQPIISVATDGWSSRYNRRSVSIVISSINWDKAILTTSLAGMLPLEESHSASNLIALYKEAIALVLDPPPKIGSATTDNAANESSAGWGIALERTPCYAHSIQLWIREICSMGCISRLIRFPLKFIAKLSEFELSWSSARSLAADYGIILVRPPTRVKTRWWSDLPVLLYYVKFENVLKQIFKRYFEDTWYSTDTNPDVAQILVLLDFLKKGTFLFFFFCFFCFFGPI